MMPKKEGYRTVVGTCVKGVVLTKKETESIVKRLVPFELLRLGPGFICQKPEENMRTEKSLRAGEASVERIKKEAGNMGRDPQ